MVKFKISLGFTIACISMVVSLNAQAQSLKKQLSLGTELYKKQKYVEAEKHFEGGAGNTELNEIAGFNKADALFQQEKYDEAAKQFLGLAETTKNKELKAKSYHNLGNTLLKGKDYENAVKAYKNALLANSNDEDTRYNLGYAMQQLKKEQEKKQDKQQQQQQQQQQEDNKENKKEEQQDQQQKQKQQQQALNKQNAENMLDALNETEKGVQKKVKDKKGKGVKGKVEKDW